MDLSKHQFYLSVRDNSVSNETFELYHDSELDMLITAPQPQGQELDKYYESEDYISHTDNKRSLFEKAYHFVKSIALREKVQLINRLQPLKGALLDIGAGTGDFLVAAKNAGWKTTGLEPNNKAKEIAVKKGIEFAAEQALLPDASFDAITMWHVLEHVPDLQTQIGELKRLVKSDGSIIIAVPNFKSYDAAHYREFWAAYDVPRHLNHFSKTSIAKLFSDHDLVLLEVLPMKFDAFYVSLLSEKYKTGKMNIVAAFLTGLKSNWKASRNLEYSSHIYVIKKSGNEFKRA